jgi:hypothetical protein
MAMMKPLKNLLDKADELILGNGLSKEASSQTDDSVSALVTLLSGADTSLDVAPGDTSTDLEKLAKSLNRLHAFEEISELVKLDNFEVRALQEGFTSHQIDEAMSKIAANKIYKALSAPKELI